MYNIYSLQKSILLIICIFFMTPVMAHAQYTYNDKEFDSFRKMQEYIIAYMEAWREVYGENDTDPKAHYAVSRTRSKVEAETLRVTDLEYDSVRFVGKLDLKKSHRARVWFDYGFTSTKLSKRTNTQVIGKLYGSERFDQKAVQLQPETTYYYRAGAINENGVVDYGDIKSFTTLIDTENSDALIEARTYYTREVDDTHAILQGSIDFNRETTGYAWFTYGDKEDDLYKKTPTRKVYKEKGYRMAETVLRLDEGQKYFYRFIVMDVYGEVHYGDIKMFTTRAYQENKAPTVQVERSVDVTPYSATLRGSVDMNDFNDGVVFFIYGEDRAEIYEVAEDYETYSEIRERGDDRQKVLVDADLDRFKKYSVTVSYLDPYTRHYYAIGVAYENEDGDEVITLSRAYSLQTKRER